MFNMHNSSLCQTSMCAFDKQHYNTSCRPCEELDATWQNKSVAAYSNERSMFEHRQETMVRSSLVKGTKLACIWQRLDPLTTSAVVRKDKRACLLSLTEVRHPCQTSDPQQQQHWRSHHPDPALTPPPPTAPAVHLPPLHPVQATI